MPLSAVKNKKIAVRALANEFELLFCLVSYDVSCTYNIYFFGHFIVLNTLFFIKFTFSYKLCTISLQKVYQNSQTVSFNYSETN